MNQAMEASDNMLEDSTYVSPIARPKLAGKSLIRSLKLVKRALAVEKLAKQQKLETNSSEDLALTRLVKRGVLDVTKSLRKGLTGIVLLASDVHPVDVVSHVPVLCEELSISYAYVASKRVLSDVCHSKRPTCAVLVVKPLKDFSNRLKKLPEYDNKLDYTELYHKVDSNIRKHHPYL
ncbi:Ribosomal protein L7Ae/L30e/S12e/Gadd45 family protein [Theileria parva strain Muguga]|uniref:40S ribosomal protein L7Ae, putative n=1 Tax=Theileria parva TaxID=5875 RepID=Q4N310_THEPA|nr:Ribosomal protein L7Ae/L30e/S12e/Gadd45 family protein [Theileria parva strain Muguga]EAN31529.1 Ribosomal protein L7Ae/L30e/S12e/Gadd45 family protein [Theileria parva strain Muguga]|eukprot:XP_763812.1 40S ribosomal protein L7Ae [Theileria parva strain Muguga]